MSLMRKAAPLGWFLISVFCLAVTLIAAAALFFVAIPDASDLDNCITAQMFEIPLCRTAAGYTPLASISPNMKNAVIASEDSAFWDHEGIDWTELKKSFETNIEKGRMARGGSTITQQLAKNVYLSGDKSLLRKIREAVIAIRIERRYDKNLIVEKYLNVVEFDEGIYGVKQGAKHYFGVSPASLSIAQSAWLAFLLPNPKKYSASFHKNKLTPFAYRQMRTIIHRLWRFKKISEDDKISATLEAKSFFGGISGDSKELEEEFDRGGDEEFEEMNYEEEARDAGPEARAGAIERLKAPQKIVTPIDASDNASEEPAPASSDDQEVPEDQ